MAHASKHSVELQSFRGLAAIVVLIHHCSFYYRYADEEKSWAETLFNAHAAVIAFYVLSGLVLALSLSKRPPSIGSIRAFYVRRLFRIYPALWIACILGAVYLFAFRSIPVPLLVSDWWPLSYRDDRISAIGVICAFIGFKHELPVAIWSITVELIGSLLMPWLAYTITRKPKLFLLSTLALLVLSFSSRNPLLIYLVQFAFGASIIWWAPKLRPFFVAHDMFKVIAVTSLLLLLFGRQIGGWRYAGDYHSAGAALIEGLSAMTLIGVIYTNGGSFSLLRHPAPVFIGDISYSLYLLHLPVMALIAGIGGEWLNFPPLNENGIIATASLGFLTLAISVPLAMLSYRYIEVPGMILGSRYLARNKGAASYL